MPDKGISKTYMPNFLSSIHIFATPQRLRLKEYVFNINVDNITDTSGKNVESK